MLYENIVQLSERAISILTRLRVMSPGLPGYPQSRRVEILERLRETTYRLLTRSVQRD